MLKSQTLADIIYMKIKEEIVELELRPGEKLSEVQLAKKFQVSRAPVRDAVRKLHQDNLVLVKPQIGTIVSPISLEKAMNICELRLLLEPYAAEIAARNITESDQNLLNEQFLQLDLYVGETKRKCVHETDLMLHRTILRLSGNKELYRIIDRYTDEINRIKRATAKLANRLAPTEQEMREIYNALRQKNPQAAKEAMQLHITNLTKAIERALMEEKAISDLEPEGGDGTRESAN